MQQVRLDVAAGEGAAPAHLVAEATWLGQEQRVALVDDGSVPGDVPFDRVYVGWLRGDPVRLLPLRLLDGETEVWSGVEGVDGQDTSLAFVLEQAPLLRATRVPAPWLSQTRPGAANERLVINGVWIVVVIVAVLALIRARA